jgi:dipeptidyl aminopeptidase/acylaminoacyl peptidase
MRRALIFAIATAIGLMLVSVILAEGALRIRDRPPAKPGLAITIAHQTGAAWQSVQVAGADGARLDGWLFSPRAPNGAGVILMHGVADTRMGMTGHAPFLLEAGYTVLVPDSRGHGSSGGDMITYGVREAADIHLWAGSLLGQPGITKLYGLGQSMGAAILLESLPREPRFRALVADCPFANFEEIAFDRLAQQGFAGRALSWPVVPLGFLYTRARYGVNLWSASPAEAVRNTRTPVLLIHGAEDDNIPPRHSRELHALNPAATELWEVPRAGHVASLIAAPEAYRRRVTEWFRNH